jgi:hypothetical protein
MSSLTLRDANLDIIDSIDTDYEDSFSLETFGDLISTFEQQTKTFLIARVATADPKQSDKVIIHAFNPRLITATITPINSTKSCFKLK